MNCTINDINLYFDKDNRLLSSIGQVAGYSDRKKYILASFLISNEFKTYVLNNITSEDIIKEENVDLNEFTEYDYSKLKQNKLRKLLGDYYKETYPSVDNSKTNKALGFINGFTSGTAKQKAINYTADLIISEYRNRFDEFKNGDKSIALSVIKTVTDKIIKTFYNEYADKFAGNVLYTDKYDKEAKEYAQKYKDIINQLTEYKNQIDENNNRIKGITDEINNINNKISILNEKRIDFKNKKSKEFKELLDEIKNLIEDKTKLVEENKNLINKNENIRKQGVINSQNRYIIAQNLVFNYSNNYDANLKIRLLNYANLTVQIKSDPDAWYFQVFNNKKMTSIIKNFNKVDDIASYIEEQDENSEDLFNTNNNQTLDETTKSWEDSAYKHFTQSIDGKLKVMLSRYPKLSSPYNNKSDVQAIDTDNELGVAEYLDPQYIINQIHAIKNVNNVTEFIEKLEERSKQVKAIYGLGALAADMRKDKVFANYVFSNFAKPISHKNMITINSSGEISFDYSNHQAFASSGLLYQMYNKIRGTYNTAFDANDIKNLNELLRYIDNPKTTNENINKEKIVQTLYDIFSKYFPNIKEEIFTKYFENTDNIKHNAHTLTNSILTILDGVKKLKENIIEENNKINARNKAKLENYNKIKKDEETRAQYAASIGSNYKSAKIEFPKLEYLNIQDMELTPNIYSGIHSFVNQIINYTEANVKLNSANANNNNSSDVDKNCWLSRFFEQINAESKTDKDAGIKSFLEFITQGTNDGNVNQYSNNPLYFGVKDINGQIITEGMFSRTSTGYEINSGAKRFLSYSLFDGVKNVQDGLGLTYSEMPKIDFFITQYIAFNDSLKEFTETGTVKDINGIKTAVYPMRIGSDAPKIYFIRAPKYDNTTVRYAIYNHILNELNTFVEALNHVFVKEGDGIYRTVTDIENLVGKAYYDERIAGGLKGDFTKAIVQNNRLTGRIFRFLKLHDINGHQYYKDIESMLSLYGEGDAGSLIIPDINGRLQINEDRLSETSNNQSVIFDGNKLVLNLSVEQRQQLFNIVNDWCNNYLLAANARINDYISAMNNFNIPYDEGFIKNYLLNAINMNMNYDDMFEGSYIFYGDNSMTKYFTGGRDFLKRTKEVQAGGEVNSGFNVLVNDNILSEYENEIISVTTVKNGTPGSYNVPTYINGQIINKPMTARNGFRAITIKNTIKASDYANEMQEVLENIFLKQGMNKEFAHKKSVSIARGYGFSQADTKGDLTKINDAQSYITFDEFIRRRYADGTINEYMPLIEQLLDPNVKVEDIDIDKVNKLIQVQKNFYYDIIFDTDLNIYRPRQIKNAEFVIIPKLFSEGTELRKIHDWMVANDVNQLNTAETSKASKKNVVEIWREKDGSFNENFANEIKSSYIETYYYKYLYKQQDVPQHLTDAQNKAGIQFTKKILDNVSSANEQVQTWAKDFQKAYTTNIKESFELLLDKMGWEYDNESRKLINKEYATTDYLGKLLPKEVIETNKTTLNFNEFLKRGREEAARLGMDSNFIDYLIPNEFGKTTMPNYMSNFAPKLESIAQAIFNGSITRQTLPGWHAAQVTGVGYSRKLEFDPKTGVMQVLLPRWSSLIPKGKTPEEDAAILKQIEEEGLDIHIGYRMPTEGKQSIAVLKVVGFVNECLGSTIIVPDEWVTQTGSDFDVDSVYGICWSMYRTKNKEGKYELHKIPFEEDTIDNAYLYSKYINLRLDNTINKENVKDEIKEEIKSLKIDYLNAKKEHNKLTKEFNKIDKLRNELYSSLPKKVRNINGVIDTINQKHKNNAKINNTKINLIDLYNEINTALINFINDNKLTKEEENATKEYIDYQTALINIMQAQQNIPNFGKEQYLTDKAEIINEIIEEAKNNYIKALEELAIKHQLPTFKEFKSFDLVDRLDKAARSNYMLDRAIKIMNDESSREEQYGRSKFDDSKDANKLTDKLSGESDRIYSPYDPLDQLDYFEDVMGGAILKAMSVGADNLTSKINTVKVYLDANSQIDAILVMDDKSAEDSDIVYNEEEIKKSYNVIDYKEIEDDNKSNNIFKKSDKKLVKFNGNSIGFSKNNRNVTGDIITSYTSQTSAHAFDAVKEGSIPNVNTYTFLVYKLITMVGLDFEFANSFIRQPAITRIVKNKNLINSVYGNSSENPVYLAIKEIANELALFRDKEEITKNSSIQSTLSAIKEDYETRVMFNKLFNIDLAKLSNTEILDIKIPLRKDWLFERIKYENRSNKNIDNKYEKLVFDLGIMLTFNHMLKTVNYVTKAINLTSPDKWGAKPSLRSTNKTINDINDLRSDTTLTDTEGNTFMDLIYPMDNKGNININKSKYSNLAAIYRYVTINSFDINKQFFHVEANEFIPAELIVSSVINHRFTENEYFEFKRYGMLYVYNTLEKTLTPLTLTEKGEIIPYIEKIENDEKQLKIASNYWNVERTRILGYGATYDSNFTIKNINKPTNEELLEYAKLTPAQKVLFIQKHFKDNFGIFEYINPTIINPNDIKNKGINRQYLNYNDQLYNIEDLFTAFINSFSNKNPLIKLATIDLVKYAFISEGFAFKNGYINKLIPNKVLYTNIEDGGLDIISDIESRAQDLIKYLISDSFIDNFVRSHSTMIPIYRFKEKYLPNARSKVTPFTKFYNSMKTDHSVYINLASDDYATKTLIYNLNIKTNKKSGYIRINMPILNGRKTILYKYINGNNIGTEEKPNYIDCVLVPLNLLDGNENFDFSYNLNNTDFNPYEQYERYAQNVFDIGRDRKNNILNLNNTNANNDDIQKEKNKAIKTPSGQKLAPPKFINPNANTIYNNKNIIMNMSNSSDTYAKGAADLLINKAEKYYFETLENPDFKDKFILHQSPILNNITVNDVAGVQQIELSNGEIINLSITKLPSGKKSSTYKAIMNYNNTKIEDLKPAIKDLITDIRENKILPEQANVYKISILKDYVYEAATDEITADSDISNLNLIPRRKGDINSIAETIINETRYKARKYKNANANRFNKETAKFRIDSSSNESLTENRQNIYKAAARYYRSAANDLINKLNKFTLGLNEYKMNDPKLYEELINNDEYFADIANIILEGITFGKNIEPIFSLELVAEDKETKEAIESIINSINNIRRNNILQKAIEYTFDIYMSKFSTNPDINNGIVTLRETFGDIDTAMLMFNDPTEITNSQVQTVLKRVYGILNKAEMFDAKENVNKFKTELENIKKESNESLDYKKIIDYATGSFKQNFNEQFLIDKYNLINEVYKTKRLLDDEVDDNKLLPLIKNWIIAKYNLDKFLYKYTEQPIVETYYEEKLKNTENAIKFAQDTYYEYERLLYLLNDNKRYADLTDAEVEKQKDIIKNKLSALKEIVDSKGEKPIKIVNQIKALKEYLKTKKEINNKYFKSEPYEGFTDDYIRYSEYIKHYDGTHKKLSLNEKLQDIEYKEAYEWIKNNGYLTYTEEAKKKLSQAFVDLTGDPNHINNITIAKVKQIDGVLDESGQIDARKLNDKQIDLIKKEEETLMTQYYDNGYGEFMLIKDVPDDIPMMYRTKFDEKYSNIDYKDNKKRYAIIGKINKILLKAMDFYTNRIDVNALFNNDIVTDAERDELGKLYIELESLNRNRNKIREQFKKDVPDMYYEETYTDGLYNQALILFNNKIKGTKQEKQWLNIFTTINEQYKRIPNPLLFNYKMPFEEYIDTKKTNAKNYINENVDFVPTIYYELAHKEALSKGKEYYDEWYRKNHIYNTYTHKYQPLKIWTTITPKINSELAKNVIFNPTYQNTITSVKDEYLNNEENNKKLDIKSKGYNEFSYNYKRGDDKYHINLGLTKKEEKVKELFERMLAEYATTYSGKKFIGKGFLPREVSPEIDSKWISRQVLNLVGASYKSGADSDTFHYDIGYSSDYEAKMPMLALNKTKNTKEYKSIPVRTTETIEEYQAKVEAIRKENREIEKENIKIDNAILNKNWELIMEDFIHNATIFNARQELKPYLYLLLEDLKINEAYKLKGKFTRQAVKSNTNSDPITVQQNRTYELIKNQTRRLIYEQYYEKSKLKRTSNLLQNLASAKYMIFNLYGGIANVTTGKGNIAMEYFANDYFSFSEYVSAEKDYIKCGYNVISSLGSKKENLTSALIDHFKVVNYDDMLQFGAGSDTIDARVRSFRNSLYFFQSAGEHYMQNTVLLAMLKSNRLYKDADGNYRIGNFKNFSWDIEKQAMRELIKNNEDLSRLYETYLNLIKNDINEKIDIVTGRKDYNRNFLHYIKDITKEGEELYKEIAKQYIKIKDKLIEEKKKEFYDNKTVEELFTVENSQAKLKQEYINLFTKDNSKNGNLEQLIADFGETIKSVNKKIHGAYDKNSAASIESKWFGSLVMQYHKHLVNGIMKRWRRRGYYSEFRKTRERGVYQTLAEFMATEFTNHKLRSNTKVESGENVILANLQTVIESIINSFINVKLNWNLLSEWERNNIKRTIGEASRILAACLVVIAISIGYDDDDLEDNITASSMLYLADRLYSDMTMYTPIGLISEYKTAWSSPIASANGPSDLIKAITIILQYLFDPEFEVEYQNGQYAGRNKFAVLIRRNIPGIRPYDRIMSIDKNNDYYKIGSSQIGVNISKHIGENIRE